MKLVQTFTTTESEGMVRQQATAYLEQHGWKKLGAEPELVYTRGSALRAVFALSPKSLITQAHVQIKPGDTLSSEVSITLNVHDQGQSVLGDKHAYWQKELDDLVAAIGGVKQIAQVTEAAPTEAGIEAKIRLKNQQRGGSSWFFAIAGLSVVNTVMSLIGQTWRFIVGLGASQFIDAFAILIARDIGPNGATIVKAVGLLLSLSLCGLFAGLGLFARKGHRWSFVVGMVLYALDTLLFIFVAPDAFSVIWHLFAIWGLYGGLKATNTMLAQEKAAAAATAGTVISGG